MANLAIFLDDYSLPEGDDAQDGGLRTGGRLLQWRLPQDRQLELGIRRR